MRLPPSPDLGVCINPDAAGEPRRHPSASAEAYDAGPMLFQALGVPSAPGHDVSPGAALGLFPRSALRQVVIGGEGDGAVIERARTLMVSDAADSFAPVEAFASQSPALGVAGASSGGAAPAPRAGLVRPESDDAPPKTSACVTM